MDQIKLREMNLQSYDYLLLSLQNAGYYFLKFTDKLEDQGHDSIVYLRHDVDFSLQSAAKIAELESNRNVTATYFFHLRSPLYNLLSTYASKILSFINRLGHDIALHFDLEMYEDNPIEGLLHELEVFSSFYPFINTKIVSFHRPGKFAIQLTLYLLPNNIKHTYEKEYFSRVLYLSDSTGQWRYGHPLTSESFHQRKAMHILTHPMWWTEPGDSPLEKMESYILKSSNLMVDFLEETSVSFSLKDLRNG